MSGKKHLKKLADQCSDIENLSDDFLGNQLGEKSEIAKNLEKNRCEICDIECTNQFHQAIIVIISSKTLKYSFVYKNCQSSRSL